MARRYIKTPLNLVKEDPFQELHVSRFDEFVCKGAIFFPSLASLSSPVYRLHCRGCTAKVEWSHGLAIANSRYLVGIGVMNLFPIGTPPSQACSTMARIMYSKEGRESAINNASIAKATKQIWIQTGWLHRVWFANGLIER